MFYVVMQLVPKEKGKRRKLKLRCHWTFAANSQAVIPCFATKTAAERYIEEHKFDKDLVIVELQTPPYEGM